LIARRVRGSYFYERTRLAIKIAVISVIALRAYSLYSFGQELARDRVVSPLQGIWRAERVVVDGVERPPLFTDDTRWRKLIFHERGLVVRYATDRREYLQVEIDERAHTIAVLRGLARDVWRYQRIDTEHLLVETADTHAELVLEPPPLLPSRGFHWVNEIPFHR
jgi:hypothetical protein